MDNSRETGSWTLSFDETTVFGMSRPSDLLNPTAMTGFSWKQDKAHSSNMHKAMLSLALRGVCFTAKCCFCYLLAHCQEEAGLITLKGGKERRFAYANTKTEPANK